MLDFVILTEDRYESPQNVDWYVQNVLQEDKLLLDALCNLGFSAKRISWSSKKFDWSKTKFAIFRTTWDYFERYGEFLKWIKSTSLKTKFINPYNQVIWNLDKSYLGYFKKRGVNIVPSFFVDKKTSLESILNLKKWEDVVIKPVISAAAWNTHRIKKKSVKNKEELFMSLQNSQKMVVQEFQKNILSQGEISMIVIGGKVTHSVLKRAKDGDYRVQDDYGGTVGLYKPSADEVRFSELVVSMCSPIPVYARVDIIRDNKNKLALSELELIEPELWFRFNPDSANLLAKQIEKKYF